MIKSIIKRYLIGGLLMCAAVPAALAIPAKPGPVEYRMSDGSTVTVTIHGDEHSSYYLTTDGHVLLPGDRGDLYYASLKNGELARTKVKAAVKQGRSVNDIRFIESLDRDAILSVAKSTDASVRKQQRAARRAASGKAVELISKYPTIGSPNALILLVEFADVKFTTPNVLEAFENMTNKEGYDFNGATGSAKDYFFENSSGLFTPNFVVMGPITLDNKEIFYGEQESAMGAYDKQAWKMVTEGCQKLHEQHPELDFSQFDNDGDGFIDNVFVYYAGYGQNSGAPTWTIWPHAANVYTYYNAVVELDGVKLGNYACTNELKGTEGNVLTGIGTFCHEFSHILGLPDLYTTNGSGAFTPGPYELMDVGPYNNGGNTPPYMSAYDRMSVGWLKVRDLSGPETVTLNSIASNEAVRIPTAKEEEFFLLENRQLTGWDSHIPGHGMLIWHIDYDPVTWSSNKVNTNISHQGVDIVEADGIPTDSTRMGDTFPGTSRATQFTNSSTPAMRTWIGIDPDMPITDIKETADGIISFKVKGGGTRLDPVTATDATDITAIAFTANWTGRPELDTYEVDLCKGMEVVPFTTVKVRNATSYTFTGLEPQTTYRYTVRAVDGSRKSLDSNEISLTTSEPTFDMLPTVADNAVNVYGTQFTARWDALENAVSYELEVYTKDILDPKEYTANFTSSSTGDLLPENWYTNCTGTDSRSGYFGEARPSLKMSMNRDQIQTPVFTDDVNFIKFWYRGNQTAEDDHLDVEVLVNNAWQTIAVINPIDNTKGQIFTIDDKTEVKMPAGVKSVRLQFHKTDGLSLCIDDVTVGAGGKFIPVHVGDYTPRNVGATTEETVSGLNPSTTYYYVVKGVNGELRSLPSAEIAVTTASSSAIEDVEAETAVTIVDTAEGVQVTNNDFTDHTLECVTPSGVTLYRGNVKAGASVTVSLPVNSITIVKCGDAVAKVLR